MTPEELRAQAEALLGTDLHAYSAEMDAELREYLQRRDARGRFARSDGTNTPGGAEGGLGASGAGGSGGGRSGAGRRGRGGPGTPPVPPTPAERAAEHAGAADAAREAGQSETADAHDAISDAYSHLETSDHGKALASALRAAKSVRSAVDAHGGHPLVGHAIGGLAGLHKLFRGQNLAGVQGRALHAIGVGVIAAARKARLLDTVDIGGPGRRPGLRPPAPPSPAPPSPAPPTPPST